MILASLRKQQIASMTILPNLGLPNLVILDLIVVAIILIAMCFWLISFKSEVKLKKAIEKESDATLFLPQFRCVVFKACSNSCRSALEYQTKPILINNAPKLPLQGCFAEKCECSLLKYDDRRTGIDRRDMEVLDKRRKSTYANKRRLKDRRRASIQEFLLPQYRAYR
jgi:hypothetical protein